MELKQKINTGLLSINIRCIIYSFLKMTTLLEKISKLSKKDRSEVILKNSSILNQSKQLALMLKKDTVISHEGLKYAIKLASQGEFKSFCSSGGIFFQ